MASAYRFYKKSLSYSYTFGVFTTIKLIRNQPGRVKHVFVHSKGMVNVGVEKLISECGKLGINISINDKLIKKLSHREDCYAIGVFNKYRDVLIKNEDHVILDNPSDMGNLGTIIRTITGFGIKNLGIIKPGVDIFNPKVIRASMGAIFSMNIEYFNEFNDYYILHNNDVYTFMLDRQSTRISEIYVNKGSNFALLFGNESSGLGEKYSDSERKVIIPHSTDIDSLNLPIAVGIACYHFTKGIY